MHKSFVYPVHFAIHAACYPALTDETLSGFLAFVTKFKYINAFAFQYIPHLAIRLPHSKPFT